MVPAANAKKKRAQALWRARLDLAASSGPTTLPKPRQAIKFFFFFFGWIWG
jgi:hypothetical protein